MSLTLHGGFMSSIADTFFVSGLTPSAVSVFP